MLKKREAFRRAFEGFDPAIVARYGPRERKRLLADQGIIRNRMKIDAVFENARRVLDFREAHGSFAGWLDAHHPMKLEEWTKLFKQTFRFTGGKIVNEFLLSTGYLPGAHHPACPTYAHILVMNPAWSRIDRNTKNSMDRTAC